MYFCELVVVIGDMVYKKKQEYTHVSPLKISPKEAMKSLCAEYIRIFKSENDFKQISITIYNDWTGGTIDRTGKRELTFKNPVWTLFFIKNPHKNSLGAFDLLLEKEIIYNDILWAEMRRPF